MFVSYFYPFFSLIRLNDPSVTAPSEADPPPYRRYFVALGLRTVVVRPGGTGGNRLAAVVFLDKARVRGTGTETTWMCVGGLLQTGKEVIVTVIMFSSSGDDGLCGICEIMKYSSNSYDGNCFLIR